VEGRLREFPDQSFYIEGGLLFCKCCAATVNWEDKSVVRRHIYGNTTGKVTGKVTKHQTKLAAAAAETIKQVSLEHTLALATVQPKTDLADKVLRCRVVSVFLKTGVPLSTISQFREILVRGASLPGPSQLAEYIPEVLKNEMALVRSRMQGQKYTTAIDGASFAKAEAAGTVARIWEGWSMKHICLRLKMYAGTLDGQQWARECIECGVEFELEPEVNCLGQAVDRCGVNRVACRVLSPLWRNATQYDCCPHTLMHVGENFNVKVLKKFVSAFHTVMQESMIGRNFWLFLVNKSGLTPFVVAGKKGQWKLTYSSTRWLGWVEVALTLATVILQQPLLMATFLSDKKRPAEFLEGKGTTVKFAEKSIGKMRKIWDHHKNNLKLKCEAVVIQVTNHSADYIFQTHPTHPNPPQSQTQTNPNPNPNPPAMRL
jgi:hypothetical protein